MPPLWPSVSDEAGREEARRRPLGAGPCVRVVPKGVQDQERLVGALYQVPPKPN